MADGSQVEDINALRDNDHLYIFWDQLTSECTISQTIWWLEEVWEA